MKRVLQGLVALALLAVPVGADPAPASNPTLVDPAQMPGPLREVRFDQKLGAQLPLDTRFVDADGRAVALGDLVRDKPVILAFVYYECPMLCTLILNGLAKTLGVVELEPGDDFDVVAVSIDPDETPDLAAAAKARTLDRYGRPETADGWHFLTGGSEAIRGVAEAAGFQYVYDAETDEWAHTSGIIIVRPDGTLNQYYYGLEYPPKDVRLSLVDASAGKVGSLVDQLLLYCYRFDPALGRYTVAAMRVLRFTGALFVLGLVAFLLLQWRRERARVAPVTEHPQPPPVGAA